MIIHAMLLLGFSDLILLVKMTLEERAKVIKKV